MTPAHARSALEHPTADDVAALVRVWRSTRSGEVATVLEQLGRNYAAAHPPALSRGAGALHTAWLELAKHPSPADLSWLADSLTKQLPKPPKYQAANIALTQRGLARRLEALSVLDADPRLAAAVARALISCPFAFERADELRALYGVAFDLLCSDRRQAEVLATALQEPQARAGITRAGLREVLPALITRCQRVKSKLSPNDADAWCALTTPQAPEKPRADEAALLRQMQEHQHDDTPRQVYADALTERGDARGEFIALQLSGSGSLQNNLKRQRALLKQHQAEWLGPLHRVFTHHVFHRGFLFEAALAHNAKAEPAVWQQALVHPELRFLRRLSQGRGSTAAYLGFLDAPGCHQVTEVTGDGVLKYVLGHAQRPWRSLSLKSAPSLEGLKSLTVLRSLRNLTIEHLGDPQFPANLRKSGLLEQLTSLEFDWSHFAAELVALIGLGALRRITFTAFHSCITVTKSRSNGFIVEGESEAAQLAKDVLEAVGEAEEVRLSLTDHQAAEKRLAWFDSWLQQHTRHQVLHKLPKTDGAGFHERLRIALVTEAD